MLYKRTWNNRYLVTNFRIFVENHFVIDYIASIFLNISYLYVTQRKSQPIILNWG